MEKANYEKCIEYFDERVLGIYSYLEKGYIMVSTYAIFDTLRYISYHEPLCFFDERLVDFSEKVGIRLPSSLAELPDWDAQYLNIIAITEDVKEAYRKKVNQ